MRRILARMSDEGVGSRTFPDHQAKKKTPHTHGGVLTSRKLLAGHCTRGYSHLLHIATANVAPGQVDWQTLPADRATIGGLHIVRSEISATSG